jgi:putative protease
MKGYAFGCEDAGVIWPERAGHCGVAIGRVEQADSRFARIRLSRDLADGDELEIRGRRGSAGLIYAGKDTPAGGTALVRLREGMKAEAGDEAARLSSAAQIRKAAQMPCRRVRADLFLRAVAGEALTLCATDGENEVTVRGEPVAEARTRPAQAEELKRSLSRTGETMFDPGTIGIETENAFVPVSEINRIRREALDALEQKRTEYPSAPCYLFGAREVQKANGLLVTVADSTGADCFYLSPVKSFKLFYKDGNLWRQEAVVSNNRHRKVIHIRVEGEAVDPESFYVSDMID